MSNSQIFVGMMSGTSLDAIDAVAVQFKDAQQLEVLGKASLEFKPELRKLLLHLASQEYISFSDLAKAETELTLSYVECFKLLKQLHPQLQPFTLGCHGQTLEHRPEAGYTLQLLNPSLLAEKTGCNVICDFRRRDLAAGGQGAPLAPGFHASFLSSASEDRFIINLGGIANITWLPSDFRLRPLGLDTGPANLLLDAWCQAKRKQAFDYEGQWASSGQVLPELLELLLSDPYFSLPAPKSTGREKFNLNWLERQLHTFDIQEFKEQDIQATLVELTVISLCNALNQIDQQQTAHLYVCGGGARNTYLMERIAQESGRKTASTSQLGIPAQDVEALAFAWLAYRHQQHLSGNLAEVTGASGPRILGGYYPA